MAEEERPAPDLRKLFELWTDSSLKIQVIVFFHENPGVIETVEGLARRIGTNAEAIRKEVADHVSLGFLRERGVGTKTVLVYDPARENDIRAYVAEAVRRGRGRRS